MESFLLIIAIVSSLCLLIAVYRLNTVLSKIQHNTGTSFLMDKTLVGLNLTGKWLTLFGAVATFPMSIGLIFFAECSVKWVVYFGVAGCLAIMAAAMLLMPALLGFGLTRPIQVKMMVNRLIRVILNQAKQLIRNKPIFWWVAGLLLAVLFFPQLEEWISGAVYVIGIFLAGRLGLLDEIDHDFEAKWGGSAYNYATGKWDDGYQEGGLY
ncbi:hypothetical protein GO003_020790 [Methylicorpusculum oleiharenae]|uniref:hypothetical protein n=1 Tax=Methylicorpusculum oleiharenae TaxID=1338687 RepID=UPI001359D900|nr:hypothetical protein [Methylicorpusculum oleiharenae]MCD2452825.1 hypothetical protein [Methylicorpusculum oleiharenae]